MARIAKADVHSALHRAAQNIKDAAGADGRCSRADIQAKLATLEGTDRTLTDLFFRFIDHRDAASGAAVTARDVDRAVAYAEEKLIDAYDLNNNGLSAAEIARMSVTGKSAVALARELKRAAAPGRPDGHPPEVYAERLAEIFPSSPQEMESTAIAFPPRAVEWYANEMEVRTSVQEHDPAESHGEFFARTRDALIDRQRQMTFENMCEEPDPSWPNDGWDVCTGEKTGMGREFLESYLLPLAKGEARDGLRALLDDPAFDCDVSWYELYDIGMEVIGDELLVITPKGGDASTVINLSYVHA